MEIESKGLRVDLSRAQWRRSTRSGPSGEMCVEVAFVDGAAAVRDSKDPDGPVLLFTADEWGAFRDGMLDGEFDLV